MPRSRGRTTAPSFTAGGRKLPGGRAWLLISLAFVASCGSSAAPTATRSTAPAAAVAPPAVPTLGTKPPTGLVLPTYFVTVTTSGNGSLAVLTTPTSMCRLGIRMPSGASVDAGQKAADAGGAASWTFAPLAEHGVSIFSVRCTLGDQAQTASAQVVLP